MPRHSIISVLDKAVTDSTGIAYVHIYETRFPAKAPHVSKRPENVNLVECAAYMTGIDSEFA